MKTWARWVQIATVLLWLLVGLEHPVIAMFALAVVCIFWAHDGHQWMNLQRETLELARTIQARLEQRKAT